MRIDPIVPASVTLTNNGLTVQVTAADVNAFIAERKFSGKWYFEVRIEPGHVVGAIGVRACDPGVSINQHGNHAGFWVMATDNGKYYNYGDNSVDNGAYTSSATSAVGDVWGVAVDLSANKIWFSKNGVWWGDPAAGTGNLSIGTPTSKGYFPALTFAATGNTFMTARLKSGFTSYAAPSGFTAWGDSVRTFDPVNVNTHSGVTLSNGNRTLAYNNTGAVITGGWCDEGIVGRKIYFEGKFDSGGTDVVGIGIQANQAVGDPADPFTAANASGGSRGDRMFMTNSGKLYDKDLLVYTGSSFLSSDTAMFAYDPATGNVWLGKNGAWFNSGEPANGLNPVYTLLSTYNPGKSYKAGALALTSGAYQVTMNFGSVAPTYTIPAGFSMMGRYWDSIAASVAVKASMSALKKRFATIASQGAVTSTMAASRRVSATVASQGNVTTAFSPKRIVSATLAAAVVATTTMAAKATFKVSFGTVVNGVATIDLTEIPYLGYVANRENGAHSLYRDFDFNSMTAFNEVYYGARTDGIYVLDGTTDVNGQAISVRVRTGRDALGVDQQKRVAEAWVGIKATGTMQLKVVHEDASVYVYNMTVANPQRALGRAKFGKGYRSNSLQIELVNTAGMDFDVDTIQIYPVILQRRVP